MHYKKLIQVLDRLENNLSTVVPLIGVVIGSLITGSMSLLLEKQRLNNQKQTELRARRQQVQVDAVVAAGHVVSTFSHVFALNWNEETTDDPETADRDQAEAMEEHLRELDALFDRALQIDVIASREVAALVRSIPEIILTYLAEAQNDQKFYAEKVQLAEDKLESTLELLREKVRQDLGSDDVN